jgi:hypothetical protein
MLSIASTELRTSTYPCTPVCGSTTMATLSIPVSKSKKLLQPQASPSQPSPAAVAVFSTAELCEAILEYPPYNQLWRAQAVSKEWRSTLHASDRLCKTLFLRPSPVTATNLRHRTDIYITPCSRAQTQLETGETIRILHPMLWTYGERFHEHHRHHSVEGITFHRSILLKADHEITW